MFLLPLMQCQMLEQLVLRVELLKRYFIFLCYKYCLPFLTVAIKFYCTCISHRNTSLPNPAAIVVSIIIPYHLSLWMILYLMQLISIHTVYYKSINPVHTGHLEPRAKIHKHRGSLGTASIYDFFCGNSWKDNSYVYNHNHVNVVLFSSNTV